MVEELTSNRSRTPKVKSLPNLSHAFSRLSDYKLSDTESRYPSLTSHQRIGRPCSQRASTMSSSRKLGEMTSRVHSVSVAPQLSQKIRSEEHTSELQSRLHLVCRLLL